MILKPRSAVLLVTLTTLTLAACGKSHDSEDNTQDTGSLQTAAPPATKQVDLVTWNSSNEPSSLDPLKAFSGTELIIGANVCEALLAYTPEGELVPGLATSVDKPNTTTYVVHLRPGVTFSDGSPMTAEDVKFSLDRTIDPESGSYYGSYAVNVDNVTVTDPETVTITMKTPDMVFERMLATPLARVVEQADAEQAGKAYGGPDHPPICTGPYVIEKWTKGDNVMLEANDSWWNASEQPLLTHAAKFTFVSDDSTATSAMLTGDIDGTFVPGTNAGSEKLTTADNGQLYLGSSIGQNVLVPTQMDGDSPLADVKVREALAKSIDYDGVISTVLGTSYQPLRTLVPPGAFGYARDTFQAAYDSFPEPARDIEGAKELLAEAGNPHPAITIAAYAPAPESVSLAEVIQSNAKEAGFDVTVKSMSDGEFFPLYSNAKAREKVDAFLTDWFVDVPDPLPFYQQLTAPGGAANFNDYDDPQVSALLDQAQATADDTARAELVVQAQQIIVDDLAWIPIAAPADALWLNDRLGGATASSAYSFYAPWLATVGGR